MPVLLGTDSPQIFSVPGFSIHHEMQVMVESGISPADVLYAGTRAVAEFYDATDEFGAVAPGLRADLVLLNADPAADINNFADRAGVMLGGRWITAKLNSTPSWQRSTRRAATPAVGSVDSPAGVRQRHHRSEDPRGLRALRVARIASTASMSPAV